MFSALLWGCLAVYIVIRLCCLGTLGGGYVAGFGASQLSLMVQRWLDIDTIKRLFYPFNVALFPGPSVYGQLLSASYVTICGALSWKLFTRRLNIPMALFLLGWMATAIAPIFQLWGIGLNLEGARFYFFMSVPLMMMAPLLLLEPPTIAAQNRQNPDALILKLFACASAVLLLVMVKITAATDMEWVRSGRELKQVLQQAQALAQSHPSGRIVLFAIPKDRSGAHQILNGITFLKALKNPFMQKNLDDRFVVFDPIMFGPDQLINAERLKRVEAGRDFAGSFIWSSKELKFAPLTPGAQASRLQPSRRPHSPTLEPGFSADTGALDLTVNPVSQSWLPHTSGHAQYNIQGNEIELIRPASGDGVQIQSLSINPNQFDFLTFQYKADGVPPNAMWRVTAEGETSSETGGPCLATGAIKPSAVYRNASIRLSRYWRWFTNGAITSLTIEPGPCAKVTLRNLQVIPAQMCAPKLSPKSVTENGAGFIELRGADNLALLLDRGKIPGATGFQVEVGKPNFFFENFDENSNVDVVKERILVASTGGATASLTIPPETFPTAGFCQIRARCVTRSGEPIGEFSDTLTVKVIR